MKIHNAWYENGKLLSQITHGLTSLDVKYDQGSDTLTTWGDESLDLLAEFKSALDEQKPGIRH